MPVVMRRLSGTYVIIVTVNIYIPLEHKVTFLIVQKFHVRATRNTTENHFIYFSFNETPSVKTVKPTWSIFIVSILNKLTIEK